MGRLDHRMAVCAGALAIAASAFAGESYSGVEEYLKAINSPAMRQELGVAQVRRPEDVVNRLEVVFQESVSSRQRERVLHDLGQQFLQLLFQETQISTVTVREQNAQGQMLNQVIVSLGSPLQAPASAAPAATLPMGKGD